MLINFLISVGVSRWRGVFARLELEAVGKARRPFIRVS